MASRIKGKSKKSEEPVAARARYFDLYDLAPVAYCAVGEMGLVFSE